MKIFWKAYGWVFYRHLKRWFRKMVRASEPKWKFEKTCYGYLIWPNIWWWLLYRTVFKFCKGCYWDYWRPFCKWDKVLIHKPWYARFIHWFGSYTAGMAISGGRCEHCGSEKGDPVDLSGDETGNTFELKGTQTVGTQEGTDHQFWGITICPCCGYRAEYSDGSL